MAYRVPRFYFHHALRRAGVAAITSSTFSAANPRAYVHDSGLSKLGTFDAAATNQYVAADRGAGFASLPNCDTLIIPSGHTVSTNTLEVRHRAVAIPDGVSGTLIYGPTAQAAGLRVLTLGTPLSFRHFSVTVPASGAWSFPELWMTQLRTTTRGPAFDWIDGDAQNHVESKLPSGESYRLQLGEDQRYFAFTYKALSGADLAVFQDMKTETQNGFYPLYVDGPDDTEPPILMRVLSGLEKLQDFPNPLMSVEHTITLRLLEELA